MSESTKDEPNIFAEALASQLDSIRQATLNEIRNAIQNLPRHGWVGGLRGYYAAEDVLRVLDEALPVLKDEE